MYLPQEIEIWYVIPALRKSFTEIMSKKGLKQKEIAEKLNLGKSAVSQYMKSQRGTEIKFKKEFIKKIEESVDKILANKSNSRKEIIYLCNVLKKEGMLCCFHKEKDKNIKKCEVCLK